MNTLYSSFRTAIQHGVYALCDGLLSRLARWGVTPNMVTTVGLLGNALAAALLVASALLQPQPNAWHVGGCGLLILLSSLFDMLDGRLARTAHMETRFGAFYDSVLDRYCELLTLSAIAFFFFRYDHPLSALATLLALIGSIMVSYVRARAEGIGADCKVGLMQRPERVVLTALGALLTPACGLWALLLPQLLIALLANATAVARILHVRKQLK